MTSKVEQLEKRIDSILKNREEELTALRNEATADRQRAEAASQALEAATAANDIDAYRNAKAEKELAMDFATLHEARAKMLQEKELVAEAEYTAGRDAVLDEVRALLAASNKRAAGLLAELESIAESDSAIINRANNALLRWQDTIFRDPSLRSNAGAIVEKRLAHIDISPVTTMVYQIRDRFDYKRIMEGRN